MSLPQTLRRLLICLALFTSSAWALTPKQALEMVAGEAETRIAALNAVLSGADDKTVALIQAMADDAVKFTDKAVYVMKDGKGFDPVTGAELAVPEDADDVINNNQMRG